MFNTLLGIHIDDKPLSTQLDFSKTCLYCKRFVFRMNTARTEAICWATTYCSSSGFYNDALAFCCSIKLSVLRTTASKVLAGLPKVSSFK